MRRQICFKEDFLPLLRRSGGALVAESEAWKSIEKEFESIYISHVADENMLATDLYRMANDPKAVFFLEIVGVPGVGKSRLIRELIEGLKPEGFNFRNEIKKVKDTFEFIDVEGAKPHSERAPRRSQKRLVWVTLNIDEFVSVGESGNPLADLYQKLRRGLYKGESLILSGNVGVLEAKEAKQSIKEIQALMELRNDRRIPYIRYPEAPLYWTKEYGIKIERSGVEGDPFFLTSGSDGFRRYSMSMIRLAEMVLEKCTLNANTDTNCKDCVGPHCLGYVKEVKTLLSGDFVQRLHNLLQFLWLKHRDVYLTARALNIFWGYTLGELWRSLEYEKNSQKKIDRSLIYQATYSSKLPSIYGASEYPLVETRIHRIRDPIFERDFLGSKLSLLKHITHRTRRKLEHFFEGLEETEYRRRIYGGAFEEFLDEKTLASNLTRIGKRLVMMRLHRSLLYIPEKYDEIYRDPWRFETLLLAAKLVGVPPIKISTPLMIFDESLLNEVDIQAGVAFEEVEHPVYYISHREKILRLKLKFGEDVSKSRRKLLREKAPSIHIDLEDYISLRNLIKGIGEPVIDLLPSTKVKVNSFMREIDGFVDHNIRPILWKYLRKDIIRGDTSLILARTLGADSVECEAEIKGENFVVEQEGQTVFSCSRRMFSEPSI